VQNINWKKWFDRMQPQTLQIATWLLYINGFFAFANFVDSRMELGYIRRFFTFGPVYGLVVIAVHVLGGLLMANERKIGFKIAIAASFTPFLSNLIVYRSLIGVSFLGSIFDIALIALLLHTQSRSHQKVWFR
jgi:uncharacterized membrane-anchored protein